MLWRDLHGIRVSDFHARAAGVERYLVRDIDSLPMALSPAELLRDARRADSKRPNKQGRRLK
jgi:hypothetical protein